MDELGDGIRRVTLPSADSAGARPRVPPARRGRLDARRHRASGCPTRRSTWARGARAGRRACRDASSSRTSIPTTSARPPISTSSPARPSSRARSTTRSASSSGGTPAWSERIVEWFRLPRRARRRHGTSSSGRARVYRPFIRYQRDPILVEAGRARRRLGADRRARPRGRAALPPARRRPRRRGPPAREDHADGRALAGEPRRPARRLPRRARAHDRARAADRAARPRRPDRGSRRPRARAQGAPPPAPRGGGRGAHRRAADRATSCRSRSSAPT